MEKKTSLVGDVVRVGIRLVTDIDTYRGVVLGETANGLFLDDGRGEKLFPWTSIVYVLKDKKKEENEANG